MSGIKTEIEINGVKVSRKLFLDLCKLGGVWEREAEAEFDGVMMDIFLHKVSPRAAEHELLIYLQNVVGPKINEILQPIGKAQNAE